MFKQRIAEILLLSLILMLVYPSAFVYSAKPEPEAVLLIYDSLAVNTTKAGNVEAMKRLLASFGAKVTVDSVDSYKKDTMQSYSQVIMVSNLSDFNSLSSDYIEDFKAYEGHYLHVGMNIPIQVQEKLKLETQEVHQDTAALSIDQLSEASIQIENLTYIVQAAGTSYGRISSYDDRELEGPYGVRNDRYTYVPYYEQGNLSEIAMAYVLRDWLAITETTSTYLLFKEIYPFSDLELLVKLADRLYEAGIPFLVSVRPVFNNTEYPAMQRYVEALKHVQSRNGSILVNSPAVASTISQDVTILKSQMSSFLNVLADNGIVPLGMGTEMYWSYDQHYSQEGMDFFDSAVLFPNERVMYSAQINDSKSFSSSLYSIRMDELQQFEQEGKVLQPLAMNTALTFNMVNDEAELEKILTQLRSSWINFTDYKLGTHTVQTAVHTMTSRDGQLAIDGKSVGLSESMKEIGMEHVYIPEGEKSFTKWFSVQNNIFVVLILFTLIIFVLFLIIGYRLYKRKFMSQGGRL